MFNQVLDEDKTINPPGALFSCSYTHPILQEDSVSLWKKVWVSPLLAYANIILFFLNGHSRVDAPNWHSDTDACLHLQLSPK